MPDLIIDGRPVTVAKGKMVIEAAEALGIVIPRFCWHPALGAAGACRMCAVMFTDGPVKGLEMSCMTPAADGMVVETFHPEAVAFRRRIIELLMANHPHDCPVCDEGGHCLLQDETISGGHSLRRWPGTKRTYLDQDLGPFIQHEMNRCIHCYRCVRFYQDYCGYRDFGPMQNANRVYFGRFENGALTSPFAGNLADICPTGTLTDKTARFTSRRWNCERAPSVCPHCSLGCNTVALSRYRAVARIEARENEAVNGFFLCDRGRFSHGFASSPERPREAKIDGATAAVDDALAAVASRLAETAKANGPASVAVVGSARSTLETQAALTALAKVAGWTGPVFFESRAQQAAVTASLAALTPTRALSMTDIGRCDAVLTLGVSPLFDAPMLALALRQATRNGGTVIVADPRPVSLPLPFTHLPVAPHQLGAVAAIVTAGPTEAATLAQKRLPLSPELWPVLEQAAKVLAAAKRPAVVFAPSLAGALPTDDRFGLFPVFAGPGAAGAALCAASDAPGLADLAAAITAGRVKSLLVVEADPAALSPRLFAACAGLDTLVVCDCLPTPSAAKATVFLPTTTLFESGGLFLNNEGRLQRAAPVQPAGDPVSRDGGGNHPPRAYDRRLSGTDPRPADRLCRELAAALALDLPERPWQDLAGLGPEGSRADFAALAGLAIETGEESFPASEGLAVVFADALFGTEELGRYAPLATKLAVTEPVLTLHPEDAASLGFADGDSVAVAVLDRFIHAVARVTPEAARGVAILPRLPQFAGLTATLGPSDLRRR
ncbi:MAG: NADH-quinone oxidoreductase subunit NuoG [Desulfovibrio sp.]